MWCRGAFKKKEDNCSEKDFAEDWDRGWNVNSVKTDKRRKMPFSV